MVKRGVKLKGKQEGKGNLEENKISSLVGLGIVMTKQ